MTDRVKGSTEEPSGLERAVETPDECAGDRRTFDRAQVPWSVDCETEDTFLYASLSNLAEMGIFVRTTEPLPVGTSVTLRFVPTARASTALCMYDEPAAHPDAFVVSGTVQWVNVVRPLCDNPNPGMGIQFASLTPLERERVLATIRTMAYLRDIPLN